MTRPLRTLLVLWALVWLVPARGASQELRGRLTGVVTDNTGAVLPGVTVTVSGPALIQPQTVTTGADGSYNFPALPPGTYTLTFELAGFRTLRREGIRLTLNTTLAINVQLEVATIEETVTVTGESPVVDTRSTTLGTVFTKELLTEIPNARDIWAAMSQAPGFQMTGYDVGGSHTGTQTGYMTYGFAGQNKTLLEGINVTEGQDANAGYFDFGSFEEFQLGGAGNMAEQSGPGAFLNITIRSGGDRFSGQAYFDYEDDSTISDNVPAAFRVPGGLDARGFRAPTLRDPLTGELKGLERGNPITRQYDFNVGAGGPIKRGKAWFYVGYRDNNQYKIILGLPGEEAQSQLINYTAKVTYQLTASNQLIGFYNRRSKFQPLRELSLARPVESAWYQDSRNLPRKLEWTSVLSDRAFLDLQVAHWGNYFPLFPTQTKSASVEGVPVGRIELTTNQASGAWDYYHDRTTLKPQASGQFTYYKDNWAGNHNFKVGFEAYRERRKFLRFQPGNIYYRDRNGVPVEVDIYNTPNEGVDDAHHLSIYGQDSWSLGRLTLNLGLRYERYGLGWPAQSYTPEQRAFFDPVSTPATTVARFNSFGPRIGFVLDVTGRGRTVWKGFYGRFYFNPSTDISSLENPVGQAAKRYEFRDLNGNRLLDGPHELGRLLTTLGGAGFVRVDRQLEHAYGQEVSTHIEQELLRNLSARASYVHKSSRNGWAEVDLIRAFAYTIPFTYLDVGPDNVRGTGDDQTLALVDRQPGVAADRVFTNPGRVGLPPDEGDYHTVEVALNRRFLGRWMLLTSFEHTWANDWRGVGSSTSSLAVARQGSAYLWRPNQRRLGRQETSWWNYKVVGRYVLPLALGVSASYKVQSGFNWARTISVPLPNAGSETIHAEPVGSNRSETVPILDFRVDKAFNLGERKGRLTAMLDIFNATNANPITNFRIISGPRFKEVIAILDPRIVRVGIRYEF